MWKRTVGIVLGALLAVGGLTAAGRWNEARIAACEQRSVGLSTLDVARRHPHEFQPLTPAFGCDSDRVVAFASWHFVATEGPSVDTLSDRVAGHVNKQDVTAFYERVLKDTGWQISIGEAPEPSAANLCARKELPSGKTYINLSFTVDGMYDLTAADAADAGAVCLW